MREFFFFAKLLKSILALSIHDHGLPDPANLTLPARKNSFRPDPSSVWVGRGPIFLPRENFGSSTG
jgi:hypothetical protein